MCWCAVKKLLTHSLIWWSGNDETSCWVFLVGINAVSRLVGHRKGSVMKKVNVKAPRLWVVAQVLAWASSLLIGHQKGHPACKNLFHLFSFDVPTQTWNNSGKEGVYVFCGICLGWLLETTALLAIALAETAFLERRWRLLMSAFVHLKI